MKKSKLLCVGYMKGDTTTPLVARYLYPIRTDILEIDLYFIVPVSAVRDKDSLRAIAWWIQDHLAEAG